MTTLKHLTEYNAFMKWFEMYYPSLYEKHNMHFLRAVDESGLIIKAGSISKESFEMLLEITNKYYLLKSGSMS